MSGNQPHTVALAVEAHAALHPDRVALIHEADSLTYALLNQRATQVAFGLTELGLQNGGRVAYLGKETPAYYELMIACAKVGAVIVPINWRLTAPEIKHILKDSATQLIVVDRESRSTIKSIREQLPELEHYFEIRNDKADSQYTLWRDRFSEVADPKDKVQAPDAPFAQLYTSGTTGLPKGVVLPHRSFFAIRNALIRERIDWLDWKPGDVSLIGIPGFHIGGLWWAIQGFAAGITNVSLPVFIGQHAVQLIDRLNISIACVVPAMIQMMLSPKTTKRNQFSSLRKVVYGGAPISESLLARGLDIMNCQFAQIYGLTETGNTAVCLPPDAHVPGTAYMRAAGRPYPGVELKVIDKEGIDVPNGEIGEVCIKTPARMLEYWRNSDATNEALQGNWLHTGDAGYLSNDGYLFICDRIKDVVIIAGENVYPAEVENAIATHPAVDDVAVVGAPDDRWGERLVAYVVIKNSKKILPREILLFLKNRIADYKIPGEYHFLDEIPRNPSGKILRRKLREPLWAGMSRKVN